METFFVYLPFIYCFARLHLNLCVVSHDCIWITGSGSTGNSHTNLSVACRMASQKLSESDRSDRFLKAMKDVKEGGLSTRKAAQKWGIKKTTLVDRLSGKVDYDRRKGSPSVLSKTEENQLADWLIELANRGFGLFKKCLP